MPKKILYIEEETNQTKEVETFVVSDFNESGPNTPVKTDEFGLLSKQIIPEKSPRIETFILKNDNILGKKITLSSKPNNPNSAIVIPGGGIPQINNIDFIIVDKDLIWDNLGLDEFLEVDDILIVHY
jgi:hypothetical protein